MTAKRYAAFLRGMNLGRRRIKNDELCAAFAGLGFTEVAAFLASGNVVFEAEAGDPAAIVERIEKGLDEALGYAVPTFLRTAEEVGSIAAQAPFSNEQLAASDGKVQVALLLAAPAAAARRAVLEHGTADDRLAIHGRELYWLPRGGISQSELDLRAIEGHIGAMTVRTKNTVERLAARFFAG